MISAALLSISLSGEVGLPDVPIETGETDVAGSRLVADEFDAGLIERRVRRCRGGYSCGPYRYCMLSSPKLCCEAKDGDCESGLDTPE